MAQLRQDYAQFLERDAEIVVVGPEGRAAFAAYWQAAQLPFVGIPDPRHTVLKLYGQEINLFKLGRLPAQVIVDKAGMARYVHYGHSMADIPANSEILALLDELNQGPMLPHQDVGHRANPMPHRAMEHPENDSA